MTATLRSSVTVCARCDWQPDRDSEDAPRPREQLREHADTAGHPLCCSCSRSLRPEEPATCESCLTDARALLSGVVTMWSELPRHLGVVAGQAYDRPRVAGSQERPLPGGTILALLAPGGTGTAARRLTPLDVARGLDGREHGEDNRPEDVPSVAAVLARWEDDWRHERGEPAAVVAGGTSAVVRHAAGYLEVHTRWAANQSPVFADYHLEIRELHVRLEQATGRRRVPTKAGADCFDCGGPLVREVDEHGLEADHVTCQRCRRTYDQARYLLALAARRQQGLDGWVGVTAAALASSRPVKTVRAWLGQHVPWALRIEPREPTADNPSPWRVVEHLAWYPALHDRTVRAQRRRSA